MPNISLELYLNRLYRILSIVSKYHNVKMIKEKERTCLIQNNQIVGNVCMKFEIFRKNGMTYSNCFAYNLVPGTEIITTNGGS